MQDGLIKAVVDGTEIALEFRNGLITVNSSPVDASLVEVGPSTYSLLLNGRSYEVTVERNGESVAITESGVRSEVKLLDRASQLLEAFERSARTRKHTLEIRAPMPGLVLALEVQEGDALIAGQGVIVLEAMKMENEILSTVSGRVETVHVSTGQAVTKGQVLVTLEEG